jgi:DNA-binding NtrC family response regulator
MPIVVKIHWNDGYECSGATGNKTRAAALVGIMRTRLHARVKRLGVALDTPV